ncbi:MAG TPA: hypothetical protein VIK80_11640 [Flavihumibacter sp.]|jgi:hypothetical protein
MEPVKQKDSIQVEAGNLNLLQDAAKWARWLAIAGFLLLVGLVYLGARSLYMLFFVEGLKSEQVHLAIYGAVITLLSGLFLYFPFRWLYRFGVHTHKAGKEGNAASITIALLCLRAFFRYLALWIFLLIGFYVIFIAVTGLASIMKWGAQ